VRFVRSLIAGLGAYLPTTILTNADLAKRVDTTDAWIVERTGIHRRHVARPGETTSDLALKAAQAALVDAGLGADAIDLVIVATTTPDETFPAVATNIQARLGMTRGAAFDVQAVCSGFIFALAIADDGPGLSPEQRSRVGERGERLDENVPGSGLGLAIVRDIAKLYGGDFALGASDLGGLEATLKLPAAA